MELDAEELAHGALDWLLHVAHESGAGLDWASVAGDEPNPSLYSGTAGVVVALLEGHRHFRDDRFADAARRGARSFAEHQWDDWSLYFGATGAAVALRAMHDLLGDPGAAAAAERVWAGVRRAFDGRGWGQHAELLKGNAGIALAALSAGHPDVAELAVRRYQDSAEPTPGGVHWLVLDGAAGRPHHISHGTLGIVAALAATGHATGRAELIELAWQGAADVLSRNESGPEGFLVPHSDPPHKPWLNPRYSYGWCHGPAGDAQVFRLLAALTGEPRWSDLVARCWHTVRRSGLPERLRPGFWDNNGRCCGTAGVLALAGDRWADSLASGDTAAAARDFGAVLVADLAARATTDRYGTRWHNEDPKATPPALPPRTGWAMGNAGIVPELLRWSRLTIAGDPSYAVTLPDHPA